jgi:hypothetical protein
MKGGTNISVQVVVASPKTKGERISLSRRNAEESRNIDRI